MAFRLTTLSTSPTYPAVGKDASEELVCLITLRLHMHCSKRVHGHARGSLILAYPPDVSTNELSYSFVTSWHKAEPASVRRDSLQGHSSTLNLTAVITISKERRVMRFSNMVA